VREEPAVDPHHRQQALVPGVGVRQHRFGAVGVDHRVESLGDLGEGLVPTDLFEIARPLGADAPQWVEEAVGGVHTVEESVDLRTQLTGGVRVVGIAAELHRNR